MALFFELWLGNRRSRGRGVLGTRLFRNRVNKRLKTAPNTLRKGHLARWSPATIGRRRPVVNRLAYGPPLMTRGS
jgi:hypothetical protein